MTIELPLYLEYKLAIQDAPCLDLDKLCTRCKLSNGQIRTVCMPSVGKPGGIFFIGDYPGKEEDAVGRPFCGPAGRYLEQQVKKWWDGPYAFGNALACRPENPSKVDERNVNACRGYLRKAIQDVNPERIVLTGGNAVLSFFGESVPVLSARRGISWLCLEDKQIPVFILMNPVNAKRNKFLRKWFEFDLKWALTSDIETLWYPPLDGVCKIIENEADALLAEEEMTEAGGVTFDTETAGKPHNDYFKILCLGACSYDDESAWIWTEEALQNRKTFAPLKRLLENPYVYKNGHNLKFDIEVVCVALGIDIQGFHNCTLLTRKLLWADVSGRLAHMAYLIGMGGHKSEMEEALTVAVATINKLRVQSPKAAGYLPGTLTEIEEMIVKYHLVKPKAFAYGLVDKELLHRYCALDVIATDRLRDWQEPQLERQQPIKRIWSKVVKDTSCAIAQVEMWGMPVSRKAIMSYNDYLNIRKGEIENRFRQYGGINLASPLQLARHLYETLGLQCELLTETGARSTSKEALELIKSDHPAVQDVLNHRSFKKLQGSYAEGILPHIRDDGRVHPNIKLAGAASGRASVTDPAAQTVPKGKNEHAKLARGVFIAPRGYKILQLDYKNLELRIAAMLSNDPVMKQIFIDDIDYHLATAELISEMVWGISPEEVEDIHRGQAKTCNFALLYGQSDQGLAKIIGCTENQVSAIREAIFGKMHALKSWINYCIRTVNKTGFSWTWWDGEWARRRPLYRIADMSNDDKAKRARGTAERSAYNTPIQGSAAEYCTASLVECVNWILTDCVPAELIMIVHDSLMFLVEDDAVDEVACTASDIMTSWNSLDVPLKVDVEVGQSWGSLEKYVI